MQAKCILAFFLLFCFAGSAISQDNDEAGLREVNSVRSDDRWRTTVLRFEMLGKAKELEEDLDQMARVSLKLGLQKVGSFELVELEEAAKVLNREVKMQDLMDKGTRNRLGRLLGWQLAVQGIIMGYDNWVDVYAILLEIQTGRIIHVQQAGREGQNARTVLDLVGELAELIGGVVPLRGKVYEVRKNEPPGKQVVLDRGSRYGVEPGMRFEIYTLREGEVEEEVKIAEVEATEVQKAVCYTKIISQMEGELPPEVQIIIEKGYEFRAIRPFGHLHINTDPPGAYISLDKNHLTGLVTPATIDKQRGNYTVSVSKPGFETWKGLVTVRPYASEILSIDLTPLQFSIGSPPSEVEAGKTYPLDIRDHEDQMVMVDAFDWAPSSLWEIKTEQGESKIKFAAVRQRSKAILEGIWRQDGTTKISKEIVVLIRQDEGPEAQISPEPLEEIPIESAPLEGELQVGKALLEDPILLPYLKHLGQGRVQDDQVYLNACGELCLLVSPPDARVYLDGKSLEELEQDNATTLRREGGGLFIFGNLIAGTHTLRASRTGYNTELRYVSVKPDRIKAVKMDLYNRWRFHANLLGVLAIVAVAGTGIFLLATSI